MVRRRKGVLAPDEETVMGECGCGVCADGRGFGLRTVSGAQVEDLLGWNKSIVSFSWSEMRAIRARLVT